MTGARRIGAALASLALPVLACSLLRPLDDLEVSQSSLAPVSCPDDMQAVRFDDGASFCIDERETTRAEYEEFLEAPAREPALPMQDAELCPTAGGFEPGGGADCLSAYERGRDPDLPVVCVDLCDAMAYCGFRGKRLCGGRGGATLDSERRNDPTEDEWFAACTGGTTRQYPYGQNFERGRCNVNTASLEPVASLPACETPDHIQHLSGNAAEWVLICRERPRRDTACLVAGGEFLTSEFALASCFVIALGGEEPTPLRLRAPTDRAPGVGIRCCKD